MVWEGAGAQSPVPDPIVGAKRTRIGRHVELALGLAITAPLRSRLNGWGTLR